MRGGNAYRLRHLLKGRCKVKTSETATALRELAKGFKDRDYFGCDSGDYTLADTQAEIVAAMEEAADKLEEQAARIRLWSERADELRQRCDHWYKLGKPVKCVAKGGTEKTGGDFNLTDELIRRRKADIEEAHKAVDAIRRCWLIEAKLWDRLDRIERQNNLKIYDPFGFATPYQNYRDLLKCVGKRWPFRPPELWEEAALKKARQMKYVAKLLKERKVKL